MKTKKKEKFKFTLDNIFLISTSLEHRTKIISSSEKFAKTRKIFAESRRQFYNIAELFFDFAAQIKYSTRCDLIIYSTSQRLANHEQTHNES